MAKRRRPRTIPITAALAAQHAGLEDIERAIEDGRVLADGRPVLNPRARVAADAAISVRPDASLRGTQKLEAAIAAFGVAVDGRVALDLGAAAGGFTWLLLQLGAARVYAVDAGHGQLRGALRQDARVVNLERTNLGDLSTDLVPDRIDLLTVDLSYLSIARALPELDRLRFAEGADLVALVKPMFELALDRPPDDPTLFRRATDAARRGMEAAGWYAVADVQSAVRGARGAVEFFVHARR